MFIAGNWKMNGTIEQARTLARQLANQLPTGAPTTALFPPAPHLSAVLAEVAESPIFVGGQDCSPHVQGAHTGDISAGMLADIGARGVIIGHSERRTNHGETDAEIHAKVSAAMRTGIGVILCVGETREQREAGEAEAVVRAQLAAGLPDPLSGNAVTVAYEPVWAIGTGKVATRDDISTMHRMIRAWLRAHQPPLAETFILYGGSVKAANADDVFAADEVGGALVGGASLKADDFLGIITAAMNA
ncbi:MAG: triose-phosphate isomerase [Kiloniella sp.]|nr:triose-phosphate isomerase [Kiloniella sp.]